MRCQSVARAKRASLRHGGREVCEGKFSNGRDDLCGITTVISRHLRKKKSDCEDKLVGAPSDVWLKLGVGGCTRPSHFARELNAA